MKKLLSDSSLVLGRCLSQTARHPIWLVFNLVQPILYLVLFGPLLDNAAMADRFPADGAYNVFVPGLLVQLGLFGTAFVGFTLIAEVRSGVIERLRVTPISRLALLLGRAGRDVLALGLQGAVLILLALPFGLEADASGAAAALALVMGLGLAFAALSYWLALQLRSEEALQPLLYGVSVPLLLLSGVLLPLSLARAWLRGLAEANPLSHAVTGARALFNGHFANGDVLTGVLVVAALALLSVALAARGFSRSAA